MLGFPKINRIDTVCTTFIFSIIHREQTHE